MSKQPANTNSKLTIATGEVKFGTYDLDIASGIMNASGQCLANFGLLPGTKFSMTELMHTIIPDHRQLVRQKIQQAIDEHHIYLDEYQIAWTDGSLHWISTSGYPQYDENDQVVSIIGVTYDITKNKTYDQKLALINEELASTNEELSAANEELAGVNEEQASSNEELRHSQQSLRFALETLEASEAKMDQIIEQLPASITVITGWDLVVERTNASNLNYWQKKREETIGKPLLEVLPELKDQAFPGQLRGVMETGETVVQYEWPVQLVDKNGQVQITYVDYSYQPITDRDGNRTGVLVMSNDVTAKVEARRRLEESERELKLANEELAKSTGDLLFTIDAAGLATFDLNPITGRFSGNHLLKSWFGLAPDEEIPLPVATDVIAEQDRERVIKAIQFALDYSSGGNYDVIYTIINPNNPEPRIVSAKGKVLFNDMRQATRLSGTLQDITEQKKEDQRKNDFIGMVSHELKTPLTSLMAIVQVADVKLKNNEDKFIAGAMGKAQVQVKRMSNMINGFLNVSRLESGKMVITRQPFNLDELLTDCIKENELYLSTHTIHLHIFDHIIITADRDKINSVIFNLLSNAVKYSPKESPIAVTCRLMKNEVQISVKDEGMGIKEADIKKLFDRYYRVDDNPSHISGFGIGLYLSAEIIVGHNGKIWVESELGKGSTFYFSLPAND